MRNDNNNNPNNDVAEEITPQPPVELEQEVIDDLVDNLGNGKDGDVIKVEEGVDNNNNRTYTYTYDNGETQTITVRKETEEEKHHREEKPQEPEDIDDQDDGDEDRKEENLGTVFERFMAMSQEEQASFYLSFENPEDFYKWYDAAEKEYKALHPTIIIGEGEIIDIGNRE